VPFVANTVHIERCSGEFVCRCEADLGYQTLQVPGPFVATVTNAAMNLPRVPGMRDRVMGHRMSIETVSAGMLSSHLAQSRLPSVRVQRRYVPRLSRVCHRLEGSPREQAVAIARFVRRSVEQT
jgi:electron transfer flavoprotein alpha/beta subunit